MDDFNDLMFGPDRANPDAICEFIRGVPDTYERPHLFLNWAEEVGAGIAFWPIITRLWPRFDGIPHEKFAELFHIFWRWRPPITGLPKRLKVWRGQEADEKLGLSWTTDIIVAKEFAGREGRARNPVLLEMWVTPTKVAFLSNDREEEEVVLRAIPASDRVKCHVIREPKYG